jgi:hypothetical protein
MRGTSGTDDLRLAALALGGVGNIRVTFSSNVMLFVLFGCGLDAIDALLGSEGRGGSRVGLPGDEARRDFLPISEPPDLLRLWARAGLDCAGESAAFRGIGRGRLTTDAVRPTVSETGAAVFVAGLPAVLMIASTARGSLYWMLFRKRMVRCCDPGSSATLSPCALGFDGRPMVGRLWRGVFEGSGDVVFGAGGAILEGRMLGFRRGCWVVTGRFCGDADWCWTGSTACTGDGCRRWTGSSWSDGRGDLRRASSPPGDSWADVVEAIATSSG